MSPTPDYCPFCGARLGADEPLESHLQAREDCQDRFDEWNRGLEATTATSSSAGVLRAAMLIVIVVTILVYSLLVTQQLLLGLLASAVVALAFVVASRV